MTTEYENRDKEKRKASRSEDYALLNRSVVLSDGSNWPITLLDSIKYEAELVRKEEVEATVAKGSLLMKEAEFMRKKEEVEATASRWFGQQMYVDNAGVDAIYAQLEKDKLEAKVVRRVLDIPAEQDITHDDIHKARMDKNWEISYAFETIDADRLKPTKCWEQVEVDAAKLSNQQMYDFDRGLIKTHTLLSKVKSNANAEKK